jgi:hypothetical protein
MLKDAGADIVVNLVTSARGDPSPQRPEGMALAPLGDRPFLRDRHTFL